MAVAGGVVEQLFEFGDVGFKSSDAGVLPRDMGVAFREGGFESCKDGQELVARQAFVVAADHPDRSPRRSAAPIPLDRPRASGRMMFSGA